MHSYTMAGRRPAGKECFYHMNWIDKLERRFGKCAIHNLMYYIIILYAVGFVLNIVAYGFYEQWLCLDAAAILHGQIWRIFTFLLMPPTGSFIFILFSLYMYYFMGRMLEYQWGAFRFNLYFFSGVLLHVIACLVVYLVFGWNLSLGTYYLNSSLLLAFAFLYPDVEFLLFFILPIKCKWIGIFYGLYFAVAIVSGFIVSPFSPSGMALMQVGIFPSVGTSVAALVSLLNFLIFYLSANRNKFSPKQVQRKRTYAKKVRTASQKSAHHRCAVCGRTEADGDDLEFRFCSKCVGNYEYCQDHLFTHEHRK